VTLIPARLEHIQVSWPQGVTDTFPVPKPEPAPEGEFCPGLQPPVRAEVLSVAMDGSPPVAKLKSADCQKKGSVSMLVLSRHRDESIMIGDNVMITIVDIRGDKVRLGIDAPQEIPVHRQEVYEAIKRENQKAARVDPSEITDIGK